MTIARKFLGDMVFDGLFYSRALSVLQPRRSGIGIIFMLHRVVPPSTPILATDMAAHSDFLDRTLGYIRRLGWDIINLTEAHRRIIWGARQANFACFTFDDGYTDALSVTLPVFRRHQAPMCVYLTTGLIDRTNFLWWPVLEQMLLTRDRIKYVSGGNERELPAATVAQKRSLYGKLSLLEYKSGPDSESRLMELFRLNGIDPKAALNGLILDWDQARELAADPLVEIGCHTVSHTSLATLDRGQAYRELAESRKTLEEKLHVRVHHLAYPYGQKADCTVREFQMAQDLGFHTATTTRCGNVFRGHKNYLTALPRVNISGVESASLRFIRKCLFGDSPRLGYTQTLVTD